MLRQLYGLLTGTMLSVLAACGTTTNYTAEQGLEEMPSGEFDAVFQLSSDELGSFSRFYIEEPEVTMDDSWLRSFEDDYSASELEELKQEYATLLRNSLADQLQETTTMSLAASASAADVVVSPALRDLNIYAPDLLLQGRRLYYVRGIGESILELRLRETDTGRLFAQLIDHRYVNPYASLQEELGNPTTNRFYFLREMDRWSRNLGYYLIDHGATSAARRP